MHCVLSLILVTKDYVKIFKLIKLTNLPEENFSSQAIVSKIVSATTDGVLNLCCFITRLSLHIYLFASQEAYECVTFLGRNR
jgi:hypothetical protein